MIKGNWRQSVVFRHGEEFKILLGCSQLLDAHTDAYFIGNFIADLLKYICFEAL